MRYYARGLLLAALLLVPGTALKGKTLAEHWRDTGLKFQTVSSSFTTDSCYQEERRFLACVHAINQAVAENGWSFVPTARLKTEKGFGPVQKDFTSVKVVGGRTLAVSSVAEMLSATRAERKRAHEAWTVLYNNRDKEPLDVDEVVTWLQNQGYFKAREAELAAAMLNTYLGVLRDPHTTVLPAAYVTAQSQEGSDDFTGIGARFRVVQRNGEELFVIETPLEGSPALSAGVRANDIVTHVDGKSVRGLKFTDLVELIRGPRGKAVELGIERGGKKLKISVVRDIIRVPNVRVKVLKQVDHKIGYLKLAGFMKPMGCEDLRKGIRKLKKEKVEGIIFDLRDNGGGLLTQSVCVANLFLDEDVTVVSTRTMNPFIPPSVLKTENQAETSLPLVTLINHHSASASEIVSGALQDHQRSLLVGRRTFGKGTVQNQRPLQGGLLVMRETIARFYLPSGRSNQIAGVVPDFEVYEKPNPTEEDKMAYREEDEYMAYPGQGDPWTQTRPQVVADVNTCVSKSGVATKRFLKPTGPMAPDYQLLHAQDVLDCAITLEVPMKTEGFEFEERFAPQLSMPDLIEVPAHEASVSYL